MNTNKLNEDTVKTSLINKLTEDTLIPTNKFQTPITKSLIKNYPKEIQEQFLDFVNNVPYIKYMIGCTRQRACDLPKDKDGKIIVDITQPHILENMDYFRPAAINFKKTGKYTNLRPNPNPNSEYGKWVREEIRRCYEGYVRKSDGEWVTGNMYFFLNYCPIPMTKVTGNNRKGERVVDFPEFWEGIYYRFHYIEQAQLGGLFDEKGGNNGCEISSRGKAHPYSQIIYTPEGKKKWEDIKIGDLLFTENNDTTKVIDIPFDDIEDVYTITFKDGRKVQASGNHLWKVYRSYSHKMKILSTKEMLQDFTMPRKKSYKNKGVEYNYRVPANKGVEWDEQKVPIDSYTFGLLLGDGSFRTKLKNFFYFTSTKEDMEIYKKYITYPIRKMKNYLQYYITFKDAKDTLVKLNLYMKKSKDKFIPSNYLYNSRKVRFNLLKGLMDSDGFVDSNGIPIIGVSSKQLANDITFLARSLGYNCLCSIKKSGYKINGEYKQTLNSYIVRIYTNDLIFNLPRKIKLLSTFSSNYFRSNKNWSTIINIEYSHKERCKCVTVDNPTNLYLIGDFIVTHNSKSLTMAAIMAKYFVLGESKDVCKNVKCMATAYQKQYLTSDGILNKFQSYIDFLAQNTQWPSKRLKSSLQDMSWKMGYYDLDTGTQKGTLNEVMGVSAKDDPSKVRGKRLHFIIVEEFGSFRNVLELYNIMLPSIQEGDVSFGTAYLIGTSGDSESDFQGAAEIVYNPKGYRMYALPNVWDKEGQGKKFLTFFFPGFINRKLCYDKDGNSDVVKALLEILSDRYRIKYNSSDINSITKAIAEIPITPQEAILRTKGNIFPITELNNRLNEIDNNPSFYDQTYVGELELNSKGEVEFVATNDKPIREFPLKDNNAKGAIEIFEMPIKVKDKIPNERYILSLDNVENDAAQSMSLGSILVLDLWTDRIVAEYTGRPMFADDLNEIARKMCLFYNGKLMYEAHPYSQKVITPQGEKKWGDVQIGDLLFAPNGKIVTVTDIPVDEYMPIYKVTFNDGRVVFTSDNHLWEITKWSNKKKKVIMTTKEMLDLGVKTKRNVHKFFIDNGGQVEYSHKDVPIDPYTFGLLLAEGCMTTKSKVNSKKIQMSACEKDMQFYKQQIPYSIKYKSIYNWDVFIENCVDIMKDLQLYGKNSYYKFIPDIYLYNDSNVRLELLKGLMDGDGHSNPKGAKIFITASEKMATTFMSLCRSLGINCKCKKNVIKQNNKIFSHYRIVIFTEKCIFKLPRKINNCHKYKYIKGSKTYSYINEVAIESIEYSHHEQGKCVTVSAQDGLYMVGDYIVTHNCNKKNTFSYFSRMNSLHLLADCPEYLKQKQIIKYSTFGNSSKGITGTPAIFNFAYTLIRDWLLKPVIVTKEEGGETIEYTVPNLHFINNRALLKELILYNPDINVDRLKSLCQLMLYREEKMIIYQNNISNAQHKDDTNDLSNDPFFKDNYDNKDSIWI